MKKESAISTTTKNSSIIDRLGRYKGTKGKGYPESPYPPCNTLLARELGIPGERGELTLFMPPNRSLLMMQD